MLKRPQNTDTMDDVLEMQKEYSKNKNKSFKPAAQIVTNKTKSVGKTSLFAKQRNIEKRSEIDNISIIKDIVERKYDKNDALEISLVNEIGGHDGFPEVIKINCHLEETRSKESLFSKIMNNLEDNKNEAEDYKIEDIIKTVDFDNTELLKTMTPEDIIRERDELLKVMNPEMVKFLKNKKKQHDMKIGLKIFDENEEIGIRDLPLNDILEKVSAFNYVNMNIFEPEKLEWLKNVEKIHQVPKDRKYEARFDFKGFLLPYVFDEKIVQKDNRELYCHEEECHRPGYTLQEFFRLARAEILQQRVTAINAIAGILSMYIQGLYDGIIDLPLSKIFFFLRFGLDENTPVIAEACLKGMANLFYNEIDEVALDMIFETNTGYIQPLNETKPNCNLSELKASLENLTLNNNVFESQIDNEILSLSEKNDKEGITDFHLAEINLIECLERTNIIERISYIMVVMKVNRNTTIYCLKILICLSRASEEFSYKIIQNKNLISHLLSENILSIVKPKESEITIKLFRIMASYNRNVMSNLSEVGLLDKILVLLSKQNDMSSDLIKMQIECFRWLRLYFQTTENEEKFSYIMFPLRYLLEWHLHNLDFHFENHSICRIHASALLYLIQSSNIRVTYSLFGETLKMCSKKWYQNATKAKLKDWSQKALLSCLLDVVGSFAKYIPEFFYDFIDEYLIKFLMSVNYKDITESLLSSSLIVNEFDNVATIHKSLPNYGSILRHNPRDMPRMVYSQEYSAYYIQSLVLFLSIFGIDLKNEANMNIFKRIKQASLIEGIEKYLEKFSTLKKPSVYSANWFGQIEIKLVYNLITIKEYHWKPWMYRVAYNLVLNLTTDKYLLALDIFNNVIFNQEFVADILSQEDLQQIKYVYNGLIISKAKECENSSFAAVKGWNNLLLKETWIYELLLFFYFNIEIINNDTKKIIEIDLSEQAIITTTLKFKHFLNTMNINILSDDEQLMYIMLIYFGKELNFLDESIKKLIRTELKTLKGKKFKFNVKLNNEKDFESLYKLFLETFQAQSYADNIFSSIVLIPLIQKYDVKWRNIVWSEYAMILNYITCQENDLLYNFNEYLYPIETDQSLLKCYKNSLRYLKQDSLPFKIAIHHLNHSKSQI